MIADGTASRDAEWMAYYGQPEILAKNEIL
jgi:hypothetical protein